MVTNRPNLGVSRTCAVVLRFPMPTFGPAHVQAILDSFDLGLTVRHFEQSTFSSADAARAIGCELRQIAKSICLLIDGTPVVVVASGDRKLSDQKLARYFGVGRKKVKIADARQCEEIFGYAPGGVSPVGHRDPSIPVYIDETLSRWDEIHAAAGTDRDNFTLTFQQLQTITNGTVLDVVKDGM